MTSDLFDAEDLAELSRQLESEGFAFTLPDVIPRTDAADVEASPAQARLWYLSQLQPDDWSYNLSAAFRMAKDVSLPRIEAAFARVLERHDALNSSIAPLDGKPILKLWPDTRIKLSVRHLEPGGGATDQNAIDDALADEIRRPFDLAAERPVRLSVVRTENTSCLVIVMHHCAADGWSVPLLLKDFLTAYADHGETPLEPLPVRYRDFAFWQNAQQKTGAMQADLAYWQRRLADCPLSTGFPFRTNVPKTHLAERKSFSIPAAQVDGLAVDLGVTPYAILITLYAFLVSRYSDTQDLLVAASAAGRD
ncbi:MAG: condensation domain-containing protein, partial [Pseudomonadota bacterium]